MVMVWECSSLQFVPSVIICNCCMMNMVTKCWVGFVSSVVCVFENMEGILHGADE